MTSVGHSKTEEGVREDTSKGKDVILPAGDRRERVWDCLAPNVPETRRRGSRYPSSYPRKGGEKGCRGVFLWSTKQVAPNHTTFCDWQIEEAAASPKKRGKGEPNFQTDTTRIKHRPGRKKKPTEGKREKKSANGTPWEEEKASRRFQTGQ